MEQASGKLTIYFEEPFWVGVFERISDGKLSASKVVFGSEPRDCEIWDFILRHYGELQFSPGVDAGAKRTADNPKRRQRGAAKQLRSSGIGTKAQQALARQREEIKTERRRAGREKNAAEAKRKYNEKKRKRKEKHKGH